MENEGKNILLVGVGGQGAVLAGKLLSRAAVLSGLDVKFSEIHGMAQRGGSVVTQVRIGAKVFGPVIDPGEADFVVAFEQLEALRWVHMLRSDGILIMSTQKIDPMPVITGAATYPEAIRERLSVRGDTLCLNALEMALAAGNGKASNVVLLGALGCLLGLERTFWNQALTDCVSPKWLDINRRAFDMGWAECGVRGVRNRSGSLPARQ